MKILKQLVKRKILDETLLVPVGDSSLDVKGLITLNETGELLWDVMTGGAESFGELAAALVEEYDVSTEAALADAKEFVSRLAELGIVKE